jgi:hypothetical protein
LSFFEEEWAQCHAAAVRKQQAGAMQLNDLAGGAGASAPENGDLAADQKELAAVGDAAYDIYGRLSRDCKHADGETQRAGLELTGFALGRALTNLAVEWVSQSFALTSACAHISNHLDFTKNAHAGDEEAVSTSFSIIELEAGFNERTRLQ